MLHCEQKKKTKTQTENKNNKTHYQMSASLLYLALYKFQLK